MKGRLLGGRYRIIRRLGSGGMGAVYLCEHAVLGRRYALKVLHADRAADPELAERFRQEAQAASRIDQENVVDVLDFGQDEGGELFYVMEVLGGRSLGQVMRDEAPLPIGRALGLLEQVCRALAAAHASGVIHRDVKPDNILVERLPDGTERVKLIDFGISHLPEVGRLTRDGSIFGTPEYMSPEQAAGTEVSALTDVYAAGVLGFELLTGSLPLEGTTAIATMVAHQLEAPIRPSLRRSGLPPDVDRIVLRALAKLPAERFSSIEVMAAEVRRARLALGAPAAAVPDAPEPPRAGGAPGAAGSRTAVSLRRIAVAVGAVVLLAAVAAGLAVAAQSGRWPGREPAKAAPVAVVIPAAPHPTPAPPATASAPASTQAPEATHAMAPAPDPVPAKPPAKAQSPAKAADVPADAAETRPKPRAAKAPPAEDLHDPYAAPADSLKTDPFK